jgi:hypothetical protein
MRLHAHGQSGRARIAIVAPAAIVMSLVGVGLAGSASAATTWTVGCDVTSEATIAVAVHDASSGDTIRVCPGTYTETLTDEGKDLTFLGPQHDVLAKDYPTAAGEAIIDANDASDIAIQFLGASTFNGFTVENANRGLVASAGVSILSNSIKQVNTALQVADNVLVSHNVVKAFVNDVVFFGGGSGSGTTISDNILTALLSGVAIDGPTNSDADDPVPLVSNLAILRNTYVAGNSAGFLNADHTTGLRVEGNSLDASGASIALIHLNGDDHDWSIKANKIQNDQDYAIQVGCSFTDADQTGGGSVTQNLFTDTKAIELLGTGGNCSGTFELHSNVFDAGDGSSGSANAAVLNDTHAIANVENNFWGCNGGPGQSGCSDLVGGSGYDHFLVLQSTIGSKTLSTGQTTPFTANLNHNNFGQTVSTHVLDGTPILFFASTYLTVTPASGHFTNGVAVATVKAKSTPGNKGIDHQSVMAHVQNASTTQSLITVRPTPPVLSVKGTTTAEGRSGTHVVYFPVTLSHKFDKVVTVKYATANGTAKAPADFVAKSGTLSIPVGATTAKVGITIKGDKIAEPNESYFVTFFSPVNATVSDPNATGVIRNS